MLLVQKWPFFQLFLFRQYRPGKCLLRYSRTKKTLFYSIKTRSVKSRKIDIFPKGLTKAFRPRMGIFSAFFLGNIGQENVFYDILERKNTFLGYKNKKFKKSKNWHFCKGPMLLIQSYKNKKFKKSKNWDFSKGVNPCFWSKNSHFSNFFV